MCYNNNNNNNVAQSQAKVKEAHARIEAFFVLQHGLVEGQEL
jgi:hypothetical protein